LKLLNKFDIKKNSKPVSTLMVSGEKFKKEDGAPKTDSKA